MLFSLSGWLQIDLSYLNEHLIFRAVMAACTALLFVLALGPIAIRKLTAMKIRQIVRRDGPSTHLIKSDTPTMGGVLILISIAIATLLWVNLTNRFIWIVLLVTFSYGVIGWIDDYRKVIYRDPKGMSSREKYFWQSIVGFFTSIYLAFLICKNANINILTTFINWIHDGFPLALSPQIYLLIPFFNSINYPLGLIGFIIFTYLVIVGCSNAVNLTDGLDGLVIVPIILVSLSLGIFSYVIGNPAYSSYLLFPYIPDAQEMLVFCASIVGAGLAFLWYNMHPAQVFMGDVGALALGGGLGTVAVILRQEIILFLVGGVFVAETISVMLQVIWFKFTKLFLGKGCRIFKMAPLHHHFELSGWNEKQIVVHFWVITLILALIGLSTLKFR